MLQLSYIIYYCNIFLNTQFAYLAVKYYNSTIIVLFNILFNNNNNKLQ